MCVCVVVVLYMCGMWYTCDICMCTVCCICVHAYVIVYVGCVFTEPEHLQG